MTEKAVMDALVQMKRTWNLLNELEDVTRQLGEAIDRNDQVSMQMQTERIRKLIYEIREHLK